MDNPIRMYRMEFIHSYYDTYEFNAIHVRRYWISFPSKSSKTYIRKSIKRYRFKNFFRYLVGKPLLKPRKGRIWTRPYITVEFSNGQFQMYRYSSNVRAQRSFDDLDNFMKSPY